MHPPFGWSGEKNFVVIATARDLRHQIFIHLKAALAASTAERSISTLAHRRQKPHRYGRDRRHPKHQGQHGHLPFGPTIIPGRIGSRLRRERKAASSAFSPSACPAEEPGQPEPAIADGLQAWGGPARRAPRRYTNHSATSPMAVSDRVSGPGVSPCRFPRGSHRISLDRSQGTEANASIHSSDRSLRSPDGGEDTFGTAPFAARSESRFTRSSFRATPRADPPAENERQPPSGVYGQHGFAAGCGTIERRIVLQRIGTVGGPPSVAQRSSRCRVRIRPAACRRRQPCPAAP